LECQNYEFFITKSNNLKNYVYLQIEKFVVNDTIFLLFANYETGFFSEFKISILDYQHLQTENRGKDNYNNWASLEIYKCR